MNLMKFKPAENEENYGLIRPTLIKQLKSILDQYPDNGQILKSTFPINLQVPKGPGFVLYLELLQNAEDAGARTVRFIYDEHEYGTSSLLHPDMAKFQGAALYAYNDAMFTEADWIGIRMLQDSVKEADALKIGRFGLGFKSVFHVTDLPSVMSGSRVFFIDPHEKYFMYQGSHTSGYMCNLSDLRQTQTIHQFSPYSGICIDDSNKNSDNFSGTLFRFPLRNTTSQLSATLYNNERMTRLFDQFKVDAELLLLFLKNVECIELLVRSKSEFKPVTKFRVALSAECLREVRDARRKLSEAIRCCRSATKPATACSVTYLIIVETYSFIEGQRNEDKNVYKFLINEYIAGANLSRTFRELCSLDSLQLLPVTGVAMPLDCQDASESNKTDTNSLNTSTSQDVSNVVSSNADSEALSEQNQTEQHPRGQVFCFLPLPKEERSASGLPVHVNGCFAVSQNRRHLKWPSAGQSVDSDPLLLWNRCLLQELLPFSYVDLLVDATKRSNDIPPHLIQSSIPNLICVDEKWQVMLEPFFKRLFDQKIFYSQRNGGSWHAVADCVFDCAMKDKLSVRNLIVRVLLDCGAVVSVIPPYVLHALGAYSLHSPEVILPKLVREYIRESRSAYKDLSRDEKLILLSYILKDDDFRDLRGIELLPVANSSFITFNTGKSKEEIIYMPTPEFSSKLLPTIENLLVDSTEDEYLTSKLNKVAKSGETQIQHLSKDSVALLIVRVIPKQWYNIDVACLDSTSCSLTSDWLILLWAHLRTHHPSDLSRFHGLPILPITSINHNEPVSLVKLLPESCTIVCSAIGVNLSTGLTRCISLLSGHVVKELPECVRDHAAILGSYVRIPMAEDIIEVLYNCCKKMGGGQPPLEMIRNKTSAEEKNELIDLISCLQQKALDSKIMRFLQYLPIFSTNPVLLNDSQSGDQTVEQKTPQVQFVSVAEVPCAAPVNRLPLVTAQRYLDVRGESAAKAAALLGAKFLSTSAMLKDVFSKLTAEFMTTNADVLGKDIMKNFYVYANEDPTIIETLKNISFVEVQNASVRAKPCDLFDPDVHELRDILGADSSLFPAGVYKEPENLIILRRMGLKSMNGLKPCDIHSAMLSIEQRAKDPEKISDLRKCSISLLSFLDGNPDILLQEMNNQTLLECSAEIRWIAALTDKPAFFPPSLNLYREEECFVYRPDAVTGADWAPVVGSVKPVIAITTSLKLAQMYGWNSAPRCIDIVRHLSELVRCYTSASEKALCLAVVMSVYEVLSHVSVQNVLSALKEVGLDQWIWNGDGFSSTKSITINSGVVNMAPYRYTLPSEMLGYEEFFISCGAQSECTVEAMLNVLSDIESKYKQTNHSVSSVAQDVLLSVNILNELARLTIPDEMRERVLVVCQAPSYNDKCLLLPIDQCTYCDVEWLHKGFDLMDFDESDGLTFIHPQLPTATAQSLGIPALMSRMLNAEELSITSYGQSEPLVDRLRKLLEDYSDGLAIPKEMIQNADDAGATCVKFLYDERMNGNSMKYLIDEGMKSCQGPAIWAYNDATFSDLDLQNITKLGGATKEQEYDKIGKFGLGFNAVYNITDVPSFVTRNTIVIFDPHTSHLGKGIRDRSKPGIKININTNHTLIRKLSDQFKPYQDVFGCNLNKDKNERICYDGTLFRFPLRTMEQASKSQISNIHYDKLQVVRLFNMIIQNASHLLMFTQNVCSIAVYHLSADGDPAAPTELITIHKQLVTMVRELTPKALWRQSLSASICKNQQTKALAESCSILRAAAEYMNAIQNKKDKSSRADSMELPKSSAVVKINVRIGKEWLDLSVMESVVDVGESVSHWFVSSCIGNGEALDIAHKSKQGFVPAASVSCQLHVVEGGYLPIPLDSNKARAFCYLPLPVVTSLPVHINAVFALHSNRRQLSIATEDEKLNRRVEWNKAQMSDSLTSAYAQLLVDISAVLPYVTDSSRIDIHALWPLASSVEAPFKAVVHSFYNKASLGRNIPLSWYGLDKSANFSNTLFLYGFSIDSDVTSHCIEVVKKFRSEDGRNVLLANENIVSSLKLLNLWSSIENSVYTFERFFVEIFIPQIQHIESQCRDSLVLHAISRKSDELDKVLRWAHCIPSSPKGQTLCQPPQLIHPTSSMAILFHEEDGRFPHGSFRDPTVLPSLERLGMCTSELSWEDLVDRCHSIQKSAQTEIRETKSRLAVLLFFIDKILIMSSSKSHTSAEAKDKQKLSVNEAREAIREIAFLFPLRKPPHFPLRWIEEQDETGTYQLYSPNDLYTSNNRYLVSATAAIVDDEKMSFRVKEFLLQSNEVQTEQVITQLEHVLACDLTKLNPNQYTELQKCLDAIYTFLQKKCEDEISAENISAILCTRPCILLEGKFLYNHQVAVEFPYNCAPYLYGIPAEFSKRFSVLLKHLKVPQKFGVESYMSALNDLKQRHGDAPLSGNDLDLSVRLVTQLNNCIKVSNKSVKEVENEFGPVLVPNCNGRLEAASSLCYNDCPWITDTSSMNFTHPEITFSTSAHLGVRTKRQEAISKHARGIPFGQKERLTNSLRRILTGYPFDVEILKELIQNADDSGATEIHFINDARYHLDSKIFESRWKPMQGPALCVYNNSPFTEQDLSGIQRLGEGSKAADPSKTGQYGIGFSSVYHLTDAPSLLTTVSGEKKNKKSLCVFDPHCRFIPGATPSQPGMQFDDIEDLKVAFPDVFRCYLEDIFPDQGENQGSTLFRFPLRNREMAEKSEISKVVVTPSKLRGILDQLKKDAFEILLFTSNVQQISVSDVDSVTGKLTETYTAKILVSKDQEDCRKNVVKLRHSAGASVRDHTMSIDEVPSLTAVHTALMTDNLGYQEKWLISQCVGFDDYEVPDVIKEAFVRGDLALLPQGGVACLVEKRFHGRIEPVKKPSRIFCYLPLPVESNLPVHINSHFALGYENRRTLWVGEGSKDDYRSQWNKSICEGVLARAYAWLLLDLRLMGLNGSLNGNTSHVTCSKQILDSSLKAYQTFFPSISESVLTWNNLTKSVYQFIGSRRLPLLPSVCSTGMVRPTGPGAVEVFHWQITWLSATGDGPDRGFFRNIEATQAASNTVSSPDGSSSFFGKVKNWFNTSLATKEKTKEEILKDALLNSGFKLVEASMDIFQNFLKAGVDVHCMTADSVILFYKSYDSEARMCGLGELPSPLNATPFTDEKTLTIVLEYCKTSDKFVESLQHLPLLLTEDEMLRQFSVTEPTYCTEYSNLAPSCGSLFMKQSMLNSVFSDVNKIDLAVFSEFNINDLSNLMPLVLSEERYKPDNGVARWSKEQTALPTKLWLQSFWSFLRSQVEVAFSNADFSAEEKEFLVRESFQCVCDWCVIPALTGSHHSLYSITASHCVVDSRPIDCEIQTVIRKLRFPQLDADNINSLDRELLRCLITTYDKPGNILMLLHKYYIGESNLNLKGDKSSIVKTEEPLPVEEEKKGSPVKSSGKEEVQKGASYKIPENKDVAINLTKRECEVVLKYFCSHVSRLKDSDRLMLLDLPLYSTIVGDTIKLTSCVVYTLPSKIPTNGIDIWQNRSGMVFLERNEELKELYDFLGCATIEIIEVYCKFIFQHFEYFSQADRIIHLHHINENYLKPNKSNITNEERMLMLQSLRDLPFLEDENGELQCASYFHDPENVIFKIMLPSCRFAPYIRSRFTEYEWYNFLKMLGMISEVTVERFLEFTQQVAQEGRDPTSPSALTKSKLLAQHLFSLSPELRSTVISRIVDVPFIACEQASPGLQELHPQHGDMGGGRLAYVTFRNSVPSSQERLVWTCSSLLPSWACPQKSGTDDVTLDDLSIQQEPSVDSVLTNIENLCTKLSANNQMSDTTRSLMNEVYRDMYRHLSKHLMSEDVTSAKKIVDKLSKMTCVTVESGRRLVLPKQLVVNLYESNEVRPYLYKLPLELGEFCQLLVTLGATDRVTLLQYVECLNRMRIVIGRSRMTPNETLQAYKAVYGLLEILDSGGDASLREAAGDLCLFLPSQSGKLVQSTRLVLNDAPQYYDRIKEYKTEYLFDVKECGAKQRNVDELVANLPSHLRPTLLSEVIREVLVDSSSQNLFSGGVAEQLNERLKLESFLNGVMRLARHDAYKRGKKLDESMAYSVLDRLSMISVYSVKQLVTRLMAYDKPIRGSEMERACFVERQAGGDRWSIYVRGDAGLTQDTLIPVAEMINSLLMGLLRDSVLYLLPLLSCSQDTIQTRLDQLNIRVDQHNKQSQNVTREPTLPTAGTRVPEELLSLCRPAQVEYQSGEYVGYRVDGSSDSELVFAVIQEQLMSPDSNHAMYLIQTGSDRNGVITSSEQLYKLVR